MYILNFYHNNAILYVFATNRKGTALHTELLDAFNQHYTELISVYPAFRYSVIIRDFHIAKTTMFLQPDNGCGLVPSAIGDAVLLAVVTSLRHEITEIMVNYKPPTVDPWIQQHMDDPFDGDLEAEAGRMGYE